MFKTVFNFEIKNIFRQKSYFISTIVIALFLFALTFLPNIFGNKSIKNNIVNKISNITNTHKNSKYDYVIFIKNGVISKEILQKNPKLKNTYYAESEDELRQMVIDQKGIYGIIVNKSNSALVFVNNISMYQESIIENIKDIVIEYKQDSILKDNNIDIDLFRKSTTTDGLDIEIETYGRNEKATYPIAYISIMIMYIMILSYAQFTSLSVAREKNDRTMELLITSTRPFSLISGKVLASCLAAVIKITILLGALTIGITINNKYYPFGVLEVVSKGFTPISFTIFISFFIFGYIMYNMVFAAAGALVDKMEEINYVIQPIMFLIIIVFLACMICINTNNQALTMVLSLIPFSSPMVIFASYVSKGLSLTMVIISFLILVLTTILNCYIAAKIYKLGSLSYGNKIGLLKAIKLVIRDK